MSFVFGTQEVSNDFHCEFAKDEACSSSIVSFGHWPVTFWLRHPMQELCSYAVAHQCKEQIIFPNAPSSEGSFQMTNT